MNTSDSINEYVIVTVIQTGKHRNDDAQRAIEEWETRRAGQGRLSCAHNDDVMIRTLTAEAEMFRDELATSFIFCQFEVQSPYEDKPTKDDRRVRLRITCTPQNDDADQAIARVQDRYLVWTECSNITHFDFIKYQARLAVEKFSREYSGHQFTISTEYQG